MDPFGAAFAALAGQIADQVAERSREHIAAAVAQARKEAYADALAAAGELKWFKAYSTREAAELLAMHPSDVTRIPEKELPKRKIGLNRGRNGYLGIDILCYQLRRPPVDLGALVDRVGGCDIRPTNVPAPAAPVVRPIRAGMPGKTRVL